MPISGRAYSSRFTLVLQILDLHDVYDFDKLHDSTAWLVRTLRNPAVLKILVVSEEGKRLQDLHRSSVRIPVQDGDLERFSDAEGGRGSIAGSRSLRQGLEGDLSPLVLPESRNKDCGALRTGCSFLEMWCSKGRKHPLCGMELKRFSFNSYFGCFLFMFVYT